MAHSSLQQPRGEFLMMGWSQRMSYPDDAVEPFIITSGQLMGSLLSFPHLRAMNSVALWEALEEWLQVPEDPL